MTTGEQMHQWARDLWPINRSLTGPGVRETLSYIQALLPPLEINSIASGEQVHDWTIPNEWVCHDAYMITPVGDKICSFNENNLHLIGYSIPTRQSFSLQELKQHLYTDPGQPDAIPYITSYYEPRWGFCISHDYFNNLVEGEYTVVIDSEHYDGELNYADMLIKGKSDKEILLSTYICHPSLANNELSGPVVVAALGRWLLANQSSLNYSYRIVYTPETIGAITYLHHKGAHLCDNVVAGYQVTCVGDDRDYSYVASPYANTISDQVAQSVLNEIAGEYKTYSYLHRGSDERQYCSPHIRLPIASICRSKYGEFPEYHTSADNLIDVVTPEGLQGAFDVYISCIDKLESMDIPRYKDERSIKAGCPQVTCIGEPNLGNRGLYNTLSDRNSNPANRLLTNIITYCDGTNTIDEIANLINADIHTCKDTIQLLSEHGLVTL